MSQPTGPDQVNLRFPSRLELLGLLDGIVVSLCERLQFDGNTSTQVAMSVIEAGTNAIQHGHKRDATKPVDVQFTLFDDRIEIVVHDTGPGFDVGSMNGDITTPDRLLDLRGRGIFIMRSCMDAVDYVFDATGTTCRLVKRRPETPPAEGA
jgi:serine/threonine-protein kinase RsbW